MTKAMYPGGFDPPTNGHLDIVDRAARLFDEVVIAVTATSRERELFTVETRVALLRDATSDHANVSVTQFEGLAVNFAHEIGAAVMVRGIRALTDFTAEFDMALMNNKMAPDIDAVFLMSRARNLFISASRIREIASLGQAVHDLVPPKVNAALVERFGPPRTGR